MWRRFMISRYSRRAAFPYRRRSFLGYSHSATLIVVSAVVVIALYLLGYLSL